MFPWLDPFWLFVAGYLVSAVMTTGLGLYSMWRDELLARTFSASMFALTAWSLGTIGRLFAPTPDLYLLVTFLTYIAIAAAPVGFFHFALVFAGHGHAVTRETAVALYFIPILSLVGIATNPIHGLFFPTLSQVVFAGHAVFTTGDGPWFWLHAGYIYLLFAGATYLLVRTSLRGFGRFRVQALSVAAGAFIPWAVNLVYLTADTGLPIDPTPLGFAVGVPFIAFGVFRAGLIDLTPIARSTAFEVITDAIVVVDGRGRIVDANLEATVLLGTDDPVGALASDLLPEPLQTATTAPQPITVDGSRRWVRRQAAPLPNAPDVEVLVFTDVTGLVRTERHLREQNRRLEEFAEVAAHDLRNPLTIIDGMTDLTRETGDLTYLDRVGPAVDRMETLVDDLLTLGRQGRVTHDPDPAPLRPIVEAAWDHVADTEGATLTVDIDDELAVHADSERLRQLFENLFSNAVEHGSTGQRTESGDGGDGVEGGATDPGSGGEVAVSVGLLPDGFYVADDGPGVPPDARDTVFEYGYSTHRDGTGLGLPIVNSIASAHRWDVSLTESDAGGARVEVRGVEFSRSVSTN